MGIFDSKQESTSQMEAPDWIKPYLTQSAGAFGSLETPQAYGGDWQAGLNPMLSGAWDSMYNNTAGSGFMQQAGQAGGMGLNAMQSGLGVMNTLNSQPGGPFQFNQGVYDTTMNNLMPTLQGSYDAATRDNNRQLDWSTLPGLNMNAAGMGQQGSTKLGQQTALAQGMTADRNADIGASMYMNAVNQAQNAGMNAGQMNLDANMDLASQYGQYGSMGLNSMNNAFDMNQAILSGQYNAGQGMQGYNQAGIDYNRAQWDTQQTNPWTYEQQRLNTLAGVGSQFGTQTNTSTSSPGIGNVGLQLGAAWLGGGGGNPFAGMMDGGAAAPAGDFSFAAQPVGYQTPNYNLGVPGYSTGY